MRPFAARSLPLAISRRTGASIRPARARLRCQPVLPILRCQCELRCQYELRGLCELREWRTVHGQCERHELYDLRDSAARANGSGLAAVGPFARMPHKRALQISGPKNFQTRPLPRTTAGKQA